VATSIARRAVPKRAGLAKLRIVSLINGLGAIPAVGVPPSCTAFGALQSGVTFLQTTILGLSAAFAQIDLVHV
jgi:hypothetical protein